MKQEGLTDIRVVVGGVIPRKDISPLKEIGVDCVFPGGTLFEDIVSSVRTIVQNAV